MAATAARPAKLGGSLAVRSFSTSPVSHKEEDRPHRVNPLIGNFTAARATPKTEPRQEDKANSPPSTSSSAVPPPPPGPESETADRFLSSSPSKHAYDANASPTAGSGYVDIAKLLDTHAAEYARSVNRTTDPLSQPRVRCAPVTGRTIFLEGNMRQQGSANNPEHAFALLRRTVSNGQIKTLWHRQRFHERPGLRRKRLKSERWRKRFKHGFQATTTRVRELTKQGW